MGSKVGYCYLYIFGFRISWAIIMYVYVHVRSQTVFWVLVPRHVDRSSLIRKIVGKVLVFKLLSKVRISAKT